MIICKINFHLAVLRTDNEKFKKQKWYSLVIDEAQNVKNAETAQTKAVKKIPADIKIAMSGTPVENRLMEYWSIFDFVNPGYLGSTHWFNEEYAIPIEINQDKKRLEKFRKITSPFIMRRVKTDKSLKAGGTGLNLTAGNHVIHYDLWWNPAVEAQATDRAFRIGQQKNVMVHRLVTKGTLEEKIDDMLRSKKQLANLAVANGEKWIGELSNSEIKQLVALG